MIPQTSEIDRVIEERLAEVVRRLAGALSPHCIYLFGSHAYGTPTADSDIDLMIVVDNADALTIEDLQRAHRCLERTFLPFELHFRSRDRFHRYGSVRTSLEHDVLTRGRLLYAA